MANTKLYGSGPAYLGPAYAPYMPSPNPLSSTGNNTYDPIPIYRTRRRRRTTSRSSPDGVLTLDRRAGLLKSLDRLPSQLDRSGMMSAADSSSSGPCRCSPAAARGGPSTWRGEATACARATAIRTGAAACSPAGGWSRRACGSCSARPSFACPAEIGRDQQLGRPLGQLRHLPGLRRKLPVLDHSLSALIEDLHDRGLDRHVLVLFCGEFGRTPLIRNQDASRPPRPRPLVRGR